MVKEKRPKTIVKQPKVLPSTAKQRQKPQYKSFRIHKRIKHHAPSLPSWWVLLKKSIALMRTNKKQIAVFFLLYAFFTLLLVRGVESSIDTDGIQETLTGVVDEETLGLASGFTAFGLLLSSTQTAQGEVTQLYQSVLLLVGSLALIWLYRQQQAGNVVTFKMSLYRGMYPAVPFLLVLLVIGLQLIPALIGNFLFQTVLQSNLIVGNLELILWILLFVCTLLLSLYMVTGSIIALYVVTLPEMTPMHALRQARELVRFRRVAVLGRIVMLPLVILASLFVVILPIIFFAPPIAEWLFFAGTVLVVPFIHGYLFSLYRELL